MTYNSIHELAHSIYAHHTEFDGHMAGETRIFNTLMRTRDFLRREKAAVSANFEARMQYTDENGWHVVPTVITIGLAGDGLEYTERTARPTATWKAQWG